MLQNIIGRKREIELIENCISSNKPEFIAIYGRMLHDHGRHTILPQYDRQAI